MTDSRRRHDGDETVRTTPAVSADAPTVGVYELDDETVFYDCDDPLAWIQTDVAVRLADAT